MRPILSREKRKEAESEFSEKQLILRAALALRMANSYSGKTLIVCGKGNNGADGYALAYRLFKEGKDVTCLKTEESKSECCKYFYEKCKDINFISWQDDLSKYDVIVEAWYGCGFKGEVDSDLNKKLRLLESSGAYLIAADIPAGLDADNGLGKNALKVNKTVAMGYFLPGHFLNDAKDKVGKLAIAHMGLRKSSDTFLLQHNDLTPLLCPRKENTNKGSFNNVLIIGGCQQYSGALKLANLAYCALRSGASLATVAIEDKYCDYVAPYLLESTLCPIVEKDNSVLYEDSLLLNKIKKADAILLGIGWGDYKYKEEILRYLWSSDKQLIIDADGLNTLANLNLGKRNGKCILSPHPKELARLLKCDVKEIIEDPINKSKEASNKYGVTVLLKGSCTCVSDDKKTLLVSSGCAGMAKGGSGDVLSGCLLASVNNDNLRSAAFASYIAGVAGELAQHKINDVSMLPRDTISCLPLALRYLKRKSATALCEHSI